MATTAPGMKKFSQGLDKVAANYAALTPSCHLITAARNFPERTAVVYGAQKFTYREFYARCRSLASALKQAGIGRGDVVALMAPNGAGFVAGLLGLRRHGAAALLIDHRTPPGET